MKLAIKPTKFHEITQIMAIMPFKVITYTLINGINHLD